MDADGAQERGYDAAVVDLLGVLAYGELTAFMRMAADCDLAPTLSLKSRMGRLATTDFQHYERLSAHRRPGCRPGGRDGPLRRAVLRLPRAHPSEGWLEGLVKAYVGEGIAKDFYREMSAFVDEETRGVMQDALDDGGHAEFVVQIVRDSIRTDRTAAGRLALWGRACSARRSRRPGRGRRARRDGALLVGGGLDLGEVGRMFTRLTENHQKRMARMGLEA